jgi:hypothetical protein
MIRGIPLEDERVSGISWIAIGTNIHMAGKNIAKIHGGWHNPKPEEVIG